MENYNYTKHWDDKYQSTQDEDLGWHEVNTKATLKLITKTNLSKEASILNVGVGTSTLIDDLLAQGYSNLIVNDLSKVALDKLEARIRKTHHSTKLEYIVDDLIKPTQLHNLNNINLWVDRAVLHFFLKDKEQQAYFNLVRQVVSKNGYVLIAVFALDGSPKCCSLDLKRYNVKMLQEQLGEEFQLVNSFNHTFINPRGGERPYIYTLFKRQ